MTVTLKALQPGIYLGTGDTTLYTAPAGTTTQVQAINFVNTDVSTISFFLRVVRAGASPDGYLIDGQPLAAGKSYTAPQAVNQVLGPGDYLVGTAGTGSKIWVVASGAEIVG